MIPNYKLDMAISLRLSQLYDSPIYTAVISSIADAYDNQDKVLNYLGTLSIDNASGVWLDLLGAIIGRGRKVITEQPLEYKYFGFKNINQFVGGFGSPLATSSSPPMTTNTLNDTDYRRVLKAYAAKNAGDTTSPAIVSTLVSVLDDESVLLYSRSGAKVDILLNKRPDHNMLQLMKSGDILPLSSGVVLNDIIYTEQGNTFGFNNINPELKGFGYKLPEIIN